MSINPPSDIVLDVARAADPVCSVAATERLEQLAPSAQPGDADFADVLGSLQQPAAGQVGALATSAALPPDAGALRTQLEFTSAHLPGNIAPVDPQTKAYRGLQALVLQNLVQNILPSDEAFFGSGTAGMIWKSMLADQLGAELAKKVDLGIGPKHVGRAHAAVSHRPDVTGTVMPPVEVPLQNRS